MSVANKIIDTVKRHFISGVLVVVPIILTYIVFKFLFESIDGILQPFLHDVLGYFIPGLGVATTILLILLAGVLTRNYIGARLYKLGDRIIEKLPIIRPIYSAAKQLLEALTTSTTETFKEVGMVEYPRRGAWVLCFVSRRVEVNREGSPEKALTVFVPSTPTPVSGMVLIIPIKDVILLDMTVEEGLKFLVSGGVVSPDSLKRKIAPPRAEDEEVVSETG